MCPLCAWYCYNITFLHQYRCPAIPYSLLHPALKSLKISVQQHSVCCPLLFRSKVGAAFGDKDGARKVRAGKYSLVDLDSFESPPVSPGSNKHVAK